MNRQLLTRLHDDEDGVSIIIVAISMVALLGVATLALDAGSLWMQKRGLIAGTDAAALAGALVAAESDCDESASESEALAYLAFNLGDATNGTVDVDCEEATVTVGYTQRSPSVVSGVFGRSELEVFASTTATFSGQPTGDRFDVCIDDEDLREWAEDHGTPGASIDLADLPPDPLDRWQATPPGTGGPLSCDGVVPDDDDEEHWSEVHCPASEEASSCDHILRLRGTAPDDTDPTVSVVLRSFTSNPAVQRLGFEVVQVGDPLPGVGIIDVDRRG